MARDRGPRGPLFHGTSTPLDTGALVQPSTVTGAAAPNSLYQGHRRFTEHDPYTHASATTKENHAWEFAGMTAQRTGGRASVYKVADAPDLKKGLEPKEYLSQQGFPVLERQDIRPPEDKRVPNTFMKYAPNPNGRQGTLPIDWTPADRRGSGYMSSHVARVGDQWNHPTERDRKDESKRIETQEAARQPVKAKGKPGPKQPMLPGMRGMKK